MELRVIRDELQYTSLLEQAKELAFSDPLPGSKESERLAVISILIEKYEDSRFLIETPDPVDAITYRLNELNLKQKDFADIIGSKSRASEVLSRKRPLTIEMIRSIHDRLRIPAEVLIGYPKDNATKDDIEWSKFPIKEMAKRGWFELESTEGKTGEQLIRSFFSKASAQQIPALLRRSTASIANDENRYAISAWIARVTIKARDYKKPDTRYVHGSVTDEFLKQIAKLSRSDDGPTLAREFLAMKGIILVFEQHLPKTKLDGAAIMDTDGTPIIGLTLRFDRVDYFWFTLMHELVHVQRHLGRQCSAFIDEDDSDIADEREAEANIVAADAFIPRHIWKSSEAYRTKKAEAVTRLAEELRIHPAIIAGRIQRETNNYRILKSFATEQSIKSIFQVPQLGDQE